MATVRCRAVMCSWVRTQNMRPRCRHIRRADTALAGYAWGVATEPHNMTLFPTPYTLHPNQVQPYNITLFPTPYTLTLRGYGQLLARGGHHTACIPCAPRSAGFRIWGLGFRGSGLGCSKCASLHAALCRQQHATGANEIASPTRRPHPPLSLLATSAKNKQHAARANLTRALHQAVRQRAKQKSTPRTHTHTYAANTPIRIHASAFSHTGPPTHEHVRTPTMTNAPTDGRTHARPHARLRTRKDASANGSAAKTRSEHSRRRHGREED
jgi:hypothetical protein